ncbi:MAG: hypothetical protein AAGJ35_00330 [Myxococcota bacterium]
MNPKSLYTTLYKMVCFLCLGFMLSACGNRPPSIEQVEANLDSPSGTIDQSTIGNAYNTYTQGQSTLQMDSLSNYGKIPGLLVAGPAKAPDLSQKLRHANLPDHVIQKILPHLPIGNDYALRHNADHNQEWSTARQAQTAENKCVSGNALATGLTGTYTLTIDLDCTGEGTGKIVISLKSQNTGGKASLEGEMALQNVCGKSNRCVNGALTYRLNFQGDSSSSAGKMVMGLYFVATANGQTAEVKQGLRISFNSGNRSGAIEALVYYKDTDGKEANVVFELAASGQSVEFVAKGQNGSFRCQTSDGGVTGTCTAESGGDKVTWSR